jgi:hypothetical protein
MSGFFRKSVSELVADINYANGAGGATTINLAHSTTFVLTSVNNSTDGGNGCRSSAARELSL